MDVEKFISALNSKILSNYVLSDDAVLICQNIDLHRKDGDYEDIDDGEFLAFALTSHLQEINQDEHLWIRWHENPLPDDDNQLHLNEKLRKQQKTRSEVENYGVVKVERKPGNVGYIDLRYFHRTEWGADTCHAAFAILANTNALIIDLRRCPGGHVDMVGLISSYLLGPDPVHLSSIYWKDEDRTEEFWTNPATAKFQYNKPVYLLTGKNSFSAAEGFASTLQYMGRSKVVGEKTDGGGHLGVSYRITSHFEAFIPVGRAYNPATGMGLEKIGVTPDIECGSGSALGEAYKLALKELITGLKESNSKTELDLLEEAESALEKIGE